MNNLIKDVISCEQCNKINEYYDLECLEGIYKCNNCSFPNQNVKQTANIIEYAKNSVPINIKYNIQDMTIFIPEEEVILFFNCTLMDLLGFCNRKILKRKKINGSWKYDWLHINKNYNIIKILLSPNLWYNSKQASFLLNISKSRLSTLRKKGNINSNLIKSRYFYDVESLHIIKQKLNWPMKSEVMARLGISEYKFNKIVKSNEYEVEKISNRWHINL